MKKDINQVICFFLRYVYILIFIIIYLFYLVFLYVFPKNYDISIVLIIGWILIITSFFYTFHNIHKHKNNNITLKLTFIDENIIKLIIFSFMVLAFFIPSISFSESIVDWNIFGFLNYFRACVFLIGVAFLPGANLYSILFSNDSFLQNSKINKFIFKITIYPAISFTFIGFITLILDNLGIKKEFFSIYLFFVIIILFIIDFVKNKNWNKNTLNDDHNPRTKNAYFLIIMILILAVLITNFVIFMISKYLLETDAWTSISYGYYIGRDQTAYSDKFYTYTIYWSYISYGFSKLCGIPYINVNVLFFPFSYLYVTSIYIFMKALLQNYKEKFAILSTFLIVVYSNVNIFLISFDKKILLGPLQFWGTYYFMFKGFSFYLLFISLAIFILIIKNKKVKGNTLRYLILSSYLFLNSYLLYFFHIIPGILLIFSYCLILKDKRKSLKIFNIFLLFFFVFLLIYDLNTNFFFSWNSTWWLFTLLGIESPYQNISFSVGLFINFVLFYSTFILTLIMFYFLYRIYVKFFSNKYIRYNNFNVKIIFILFLGLFIIILGFVFLFKTIQNPQGFNFIVYYLDLIINSLGFLGLLSIFLSYYVYKFNKKLFYTLIIWFIIILLISSALILIKLILNPFIGISELPEEDFFYMMYWFNRLWPYSVIPISIINSIGIIKIGIYLREDFVNRKKLKLKLGKIGYDLILPSIIIIFSFSGVILSGFYWYNVGWYIEDEEAQVMGWVSENIPPNSNILIDRKAFKRFMEDVTFTTTYYVWDEINEAISEYNGGGWRITNNDGGNAQIIPDLDGHKNVIEIFDNSDSGFVMIENIFNETQNLGFIEFWIRKDTQDERETKLRIYGDGGKIEISWQGGYLYYWDNNGIRHTNFIYNENIWNKHKIYFNCESGYWNWYINDTLIKNNEDETNFKFYGNPPQTYFNKTCFLSITEDSNYTTYIDNVNFSWDFENSKYNSHDEIINNTKLIIEHLKSKQVQYFIHSKSNEAYNDLVINHYKKKVFEYGNLSIYSNETN